MFLVLGVEPNVLVPQGKIRPPVSHTFSMPLMKMADVNWPILPKILSYPMKMSILIPPNIDIPIGKNFFAKPIFEGMLEMPNVELIVILF